MHNLIPLQPKLQLPLVHHPRQKLLQLIRPKREPPRNHHLQHHHNLIQPHRALVRQHRLDKVPIHLHLLLQHLLLALDRAAHRGTVHRLRGRCCSRRLGGAVVRRVEGFGREGFEYAVGVRGGLHEDEFGDPEGEGVADEGLGHSESGDEILDGFGRGIGGVGVEGVDDAGLPCLDRFVDDPVLEIEAHGDLAEGWVPCELARGFELGEAVGVAVLEGRDGSGKVELVGVQGGPEVVGEDLGVKTLVSGEVLLFVDEGVDTARVHHVSKHDFAALERGIAKADFEKF